MSGSVAAWLSAYPRSGGKICTLRDSRQAPHPAATIIKKNPPNPNPTPSAPSTPSTITHSGVTSLRPTNATVIATPSSSSDPISTATLKINHGL